MLGVLGQQKGKGKANRMEANKTEISPSVWVIIPTWNRGEDILGCLETVLASDYPNFHIVVIDNGSTDGTSDLISKKYPEIDLIQLNKNFGASAASNYGFEFALKNKAKYLLRLDSDMFIDKSMISEMVKLAVSDSSIGLIFPKILRYDQPDVIWYMGAKRNRVLIVSKALNFNKKDNTGYKYDFDIDFVPSAAILLPSYVIQKTRGFDEVFFVYFEDYDLCIRIRELEKRIIFCSSAKAWHKIGSDKLSDFGLFQYNKSKMIFYRKHSRGVHTQFLIAFTFFHIIYRSIFKQPNELFKPALKGMIEGLKYPLNLK